MQTDKHFQAEIAALKEKLGVDFNQDRLKQECTSLKEKLSDECKNQRNFRLEFKFIPAILTPENQNVQNSLATDQSNGNKIEANQRGDFCDKNNNSFDGPTENLLSAVKDSVALKNFKHLVSTSEDRTIKIWDLDSKECVRTLVGHYDRINCSEILPNGQLICGTNLKKIQLWSSEKVSRASTLNSNIFYD